MRHSYDVMGVAAQDRHLAGRESCCVCVVDYATMVGSLAVEFRHGESLDSLKCQILEYSLAWEETQMRSAVGYSDGVDVANGEA
jgi:hypothetical protein